MITSAQIRSARAALRWTVSELSVRSHVAVPTIKRIEAVDGIPTARTTTVVLIQKALEAAGIEFIGTPDDGPGIRLRRIETS